MDQNRTGLQLLNLQSFKVGIKPWPCAKMPESLAQQCGPYAPPRQLLSKMCATMVALVTSVHVARQNGVVVSKGSYLQIYFLGITINILFKINYNLKNSINFWVFKSHSFFIISMKCKDFVKAFYIYTINHCLALIGII